MNEEYLAIFGFKIGDFFIGRGYFPQEGQPTQVFFDFNKVINKEKSSGGLIGFYHTHPNMDNHYSFTDKVTMEGWVDMMGRPLVCLIEGQNGLAFYQCFNNKKNQFKMGNLNGICPIYKFGNWFFGKTQEQLCISC